MIMKTILIDGKYLKGGVYIKSKIPLSELNQIIQTNSSPEIIASLLNEREDYYTLERMKSDKRSKFLIWKMCKCCKVLFLIPPAWAKNPDEGMYCSISCRQKINIRKHIHAKKLHIHKMKEEQKEKQKKEWTGANNPAWKGGITIPTSENYIRRHGNHEGAKYVKCPDDYLSMARPDGWVAEHRLIIAQILHRTLKRTEVVHHIDKNPMNNNPSNLMLFKNNKEHRMYEEGHHILPLWQLRRK
jgi:hypothetical protein